MCADAETDRGGTPSTGSVVRQYLEIVQKYKVSWGHLVPPIVLALAKVPAGWK